MMGGGTASGEGAQSQGRSVGSAIVRAQNTPSITSETMVNRRVLRTVVASGGCIDFDKVVWTKESEQGTPPTMHYVDFKSFVKQVLPSYEQSNSEAKTTNPPSYEESNRAYAFMQQPLSHQGLESPFSEQSEQNQDGDTSRS